MIWPPRIWVGQDFGNEKTTTEETNIFISTWKCHDCKLYFFVPSATRKQSQWQSWDISLCSNTELLIGAVKVLTGLTLQVPHPRSCALEILMHRVCLSGGKLTHLWLLVQLCRSGSRDGGSSLDKERAPGKVQVTVQFITWLWNVLAAYHPQLCKTKRGRID